MKVLLAGASGLIGSALKKSLEAQGHQVDCLVRFPDQKGIQWNPQKGELDSSALDGVDVVINLCGENIASGRWTEKKKQRIRDSRVLTTRTLAEAIQKSPRPPEVWINASAVGYYGEGGDRTFHEEDPRGKDFLSIVCDEWEQATELAKGGKTRIVTLRTGIVLTLKGGALAKMITPFNLGLGGVVGSGRQYMSWITLEDEIGVILHCINDKTLRGPLNAVAPTPVTNDTFTKVLGKVLKKPTILPLPAFLVKMIFGEMGSSLLLQSTRASSDKLLASGFVFKYPVLEQALKKIVSVKNVK